MMQRTKAFEAHDSHGISTQINAWLQHQQQHDISVQILQIFSILMAETHEQKPMGYSVSVLVLYQ